MAGDRHSVHFSYTCGMKSLHVLAAVLLAIGLASPASACSCGPLTPAEALAKADVVLVGKVVRLSVVKVTDDGVNVIEAELAVEHSVKGDAAARVQFLTSDGCCYCAPGFDIAQRYLVYAVKTDDRDHPLSTSTCMRTNVLSEAREDLSAHGLSRFIRDAKE